MTEKILVDNPGRFVLFPIEHHDLWKLYKQQEACFWTAEEIDLGQDIYDWENKLNADEQHFVKHVLAFFAASTSKIRKNKINYLMPSKLFQLLKEKLNGH